MTALNIGKNDQQKKLKGLERQFGMDSQRNIERSSYRVWHWHKPKQQGSPREQEEIQASTVFNPLPFALSFF